jgi:capsule polysaccharide export protein KpsE/RkpR
MDKDEIKEILTIVIFLIIVFGLIYFAIISAERTTYKMPNGVICKTSTIVGRATHEFSDCSDGKEYVNPETYEEIYRK